MHAQWPKSIAIKKQHFFGWSLRNKRGKLLVQRFCKDTGTYEIKVKVLLIKWKSGANIEVLSFLRKNNAEMNSVREVKSKRGS